MAPVRSLPAGTRYELIRPLAVGGMAEVHLARAVAPGGLETLVALKRVRPELPDGEYGPMFLDEVRLAERLSHPNLVYTLDTAGAAEHGYYVMEYLHGCDVRQLSLRAGEEGQRLDLELALPIVIGAGAGLHHAHERRGDDGVPLGIVHRDVSPANLFVTFDGRVKVLDFGIASYTHKRCETRVGIVKGKVRYLAPEQLRCQPVDRRSDVFALSIVLWELTVGRRPYDSENDYAVVRAICDAEAPRPSSVCADYPPELEAIVCKGMRRDPDERFASADELRRALQELAGARRIDCSTGQVAARMQRWSRGEPGCVGARYRLRPHGTAHGRTGVTELRARPRPAARPGVYDATVVDPVFELSAM